MTDIMDDWLEVDGNLAYSDLFNLSKKEYELKYNKDNMSVGHDLQSGELFLFDLSEGFRMVLIAPVASGKTYMMRSVIDRIYDSDAYHMVFLTDVKNEFPESCKPVQTKFWNFYLKGETPRGMPVVSFRPVFFKEHKQGMGGHSIPFGFRLSDLSGADFKTLVDYDDLPPLQKAIINNLSIKLRKHKNFIETKDDLDEFIENSEGLTRDSQLSLQLKLNSIFEDKFISKPYVDFIEFLNKGYLISINMTKFTNLGKTSKLPQLAVSIIRRSIATARIDKKLKKRILFVVDESNRFVPKDKDTSFKQDMIESVETERSYRIDYMFAYQTVSAVPESIMDNSRYVLVPYNAPTNVFKEAFKSTGVYRGAFNQMSRMIARLKTVMKQTPYSWLVIDRHKGKYNMVRFLSPKSAHKTG